MNSKKLRDRLSAAEADRQAAARSLKLAVARFAAAKAATKIAKQKHKKSRIVLRSIRKDAKIAKSMLNEARLAATKASEVLHKATKRISKATKKSENGASKDPKNKSTPSTTKRPGRFATGTHGTGAVVKAPSRKRPSRPGVRLTPASGLSTNDATCDFKLAAQCSAIPSSEPSPSFGSETSVHSQ